MVALQKQPVDIQLSGLDTKTDAKLVVLGKMLELENASFQKTGRISKRLGSRAYESGTGLKRLYDLGSSLYAVRATGTSETFQRRDATNGDISLGVMAAPRAWCDAIRGQISPASDVEASWTVDSAQLSGNKIVYVINESDGQRVVWYDTAAQAIYATYKDATASDRTRIMVVAGKVLVACYSRSGGTITISEFTASSATVRATISNVYSTAANWANIAWDWAATNDGAAVYVCHVESTGTTTLILRKVAISGWAVSSSATWTAAAAVTAVGLGAYASVHPFWCTSGGVFKRTYNTSLTNTLASTTVETAGAGTTRRAIGVYVNSGEYCHAAWNVGEEYSGIGLSTRWHNRIHYANTLGAAISSIVTTRGAGLASKPIEAVAGNRVFVLGALGTSSAAGSAPVTDEQRGYVFLEVSADPAIKARLLYGTAGIAHATTGDAGLGTTARYERFGCLPNLHNVGDPVYSDRTDLTLVTFGCAGVSIDSDPSAASDQPLSYPTARLLSCSMTTDVGYHAVEADRGLLITGGVLHRFDGVSLRENGFITYPTITKLTQSTTGALADGTYGVRVVFERIDGQGRVIESAVSVAVSVAISAGGGTASIDICGTGYRLGLVATDDYRIAIYRTAVNGSTYRREKVLTGVGVNDEWGTNIGTVSDTSLASYALVYTTGGEPDHWQPSAPYAICIDKQRPYVVCGDDPCRVLPAKPFSTPFGVRGISFYSAEARYRAAPAAGGSLTALIHRDGRLLAFKQRHCYVANGDGADALGQGDTLGELDLLYPDVGAIDQRSVLSTHDRVIAFGTKGFWSVGRDLSRAYVGAEVEAYNATTLLDCCYSTDRNEARFLVHDAGSGHELVWNDLYNTWSVNKTLGACAEAIVDGNRYYVSDTSRGALTAGIYFEYSFLDEQMYPNGNTLYQLRLVTGWLKFAGLQGFQRIYELLILGQFVSTHVLTVKISYDYVDTVVDTFTISSANAVIGSSAYQVSIKPSRQKCEAMKIEISEDSATAGDGTGGESLNIAGLSAVVGVMGGAKRLRSEKRAV